MSLFSTLLFVSGFGFGIVFGMFVTRKRARTEDEEDSDDTSNSEVVEDTVGEDIKLILVVRNDLKMGKGKVAAQCAHAAVKAYIKSKKAKPQTLRKWEYNGEPKIVVKCDSQEEMLAIARHSKELNLTTSIIQDAGRTQIAAGSRTVLGVGPGPASLVNKATGHLKLL